MRDIDTIQYELGEGPCISATSSGRPTRSAALADDRRWPRFGSQAAGNGVNSVVSLPLVLAGDVEGLRLESTDGVLRTTSVSPGYVRTRSSDHVENPGVRADSRRDAEQFAIAPEAVARAVAFAIEQSRDVEIGDLTIR